MVWRLFKHRNICPFYGICADQTASYYAFVSPWMPNGHVIEYVKKAADVDRKQLVRFQ